MEIKYNIWHIDAYTGYDDFQRNVYFPTRLNHHIDFIANATLTKWDIYEMFRDRHRGNKVIVIDKCYIVASGVVTDERGATEQKAIDDAELLKLKSVWEKEAQDNHNDEVNYKQGYHDAIEKACNIFCNMGCPHKTDSYDCLNNKCDTCKIFRKMMEE